MKNNEACNVYQYTSHSPSISIKQPWMAIHVPSVLGCQVWGLGVLTLCDRRVFIIKHSHTYKFVIFPFPKVQLNSSYISLRNCVFWTLSLSGKHILPTYRIKLYIWNMCYYNICDISINLKSSKSIYRSFPYKLIKLMNSQNIFHFVFETVLGLSKSLYRTFPYKLIKVVNS